MTTDIPDAATPMDFALQARQLKLCSRGDTGLNSRRLS